VRAPTFDPREEPGALAAHAGICAGGGWQQPLLPRPCGLKIGCSAAVYWITSSAVASSVSGMVRPSALAVFEVDGKFELGWVDDRKVRRLLTLEKASGIEANLVVQIAGAPAIAHQAASQSDPTTA
jgi:hypothetical protein